MGKESSANSPVPGFFSEGTSYPILSISFNLNTDYFSEDLYIDLRYVGFQQDQRLPEREITVRLGGNMERYIWTLNGKKYEDSEAINLSYGERVRLTFINETMMAHPMHLHGMFVQLENGQPISKLPNKHTIIVAPGDTYSVLLTADEAGEWAFHCHLLYHMMAGMMNKVVVAKLDDAQVSVKSWSPKTQKSNNFLKLQNEKLEHNTMNHSQMDHGNAGMKTDQLIHDFLIQMN